MTKIFAIVFLIVFAFWAYPHVASAQWFAPSPTPTYWWGNNYAQNPYQSNQNVGWVNFDFWNRNTQISGGYSNYNNYYNAQPYNNYSYYPYNNQTTYYNSGIGQPFTYQTYGYANGTYYQHGSNQPYTYCTYNCYSYPSVSNYGYLGTGGYYYGANPCQSGC